MKTLKKPQSIIFDWDNTLAENRDVVVSAMNKTLAKYGKDDWDKIKKEKRDNSKSLKENFINFFGEKDAKQAYNDYLEFYNEFIYLLRAADNALELLKLLTKKNLKIIIISNKERSLLLNEINILYSNINFFKIMANGDSEKNKPDASPVFKALKGTDIEICPENVWIIGDSIQDIECGYNANIQPILYGKGKLAEVEYFDKKRILTPPMKSIDNFIEVIELFM
jgi:phosphoglycolate phosphatase